MVEKITITVEVPESVRREAEVRAAVGGGEAEEHVADQFAYEWEESCSWRGT